MLWCLRKETKVTRTNAGRRKLRLFACGCCRLLWDLLELPLQNAVAVAEQFADGLATKGQLEMARNRALKSQREIGDARVETATSLACATTESRPFGAAFDMTAMELPLAGYTSGAKDGEAVLADLLCCVFGDAFEPVRLGRGWRTSNVTALAQSIYDERAFDRLPILADALEDAGCDNADILNHCRQPGEHVRGCWAVDLVLGKE
jgi:hypothetical protein